MHLNIMSSWKFYRTLTLNTWLDVVLNIELSPPDKSLSLDMIGWKNDDKEKNWQNKQNTDTTSRGEHVEETRQVVNPVSTSAVATSSPALRII